MPRDAFERTLAFGFAGVFSALVSMHVPSAIYLAAVFGVAAVAALAAYIGKGEM